MPRKHLPAAVLVSIGYSVAFKNAIGRNQGGGAAKASLTPSPFIWRALVICLIIFDGEVHRRGVVVDGIVIRNDKSAP
jgi:hypothetical protein